MSALFLLMKCSRIFPEAVYIVIGADASLVEKLLNRIADAKEALARKKDPEARKVFEELRAAEGAFLEALAEKGMRFENGKIIGEDEEDEVKKSQKAQTADFTEYDKPITLHDIEVLRSIGRKSINAFTSEDIEKAQKWAYKFYTEQKLGTKSPFFRAWFGDWRTHDKAPLAVADIAEYVATNEARKQQRGVVRNGDTNWDIRISREGETNTISHAGVERLSEYGLAGIQSLIKNAILLDSEVHEHHSNNAKDDRITFDHKLYALGSNASGEIALYKITVEEQYANYKDPHDKRFHNLKYIEKVADSIGSLTHSQSRGAESTNDASTTDYSIADLFAFVKQYDKEFSPKPVNELMLNKDGTPKVFYHGTNAEWTAYDLSKNVNQKYGEGIYLTPDPKRARLYGDRVIPLYVKATTDFREAKKTGKPRDYTYVKATGDIIVVSPEQIKSATDNIGTFDGRKSDIRFSRKANPQTSGKTTAKLPEVSHLTAMQKQTVANHSRTKVYTKAEALQVVEDMARFLDESYGFDGGMGEASGFVTLTKAVKDGARRNCLALFCFKMAETRKSRMI